MNRGYVKVWRKIEDSGLIQMPNTLALFMHILLKATHKDIKAGTTNGVVELKRGQYIDGLNRLAKTLKQTTRQVRTSQKRLIDLKVISVKTTNKYSVYTIENYNIYQDSDTHNDIQTTNKRQSNDIQTTTKQEHKHINIKEKNIDAKNEFFAEIDSDVLEAWLSVRKAKRGSKISKVVFDAMARESLKAGLTIEQAVRECAERNWIIFKADWYETAKSKSVATVTPIRKSKMDISGINYNEGVNADGSF